MHFAALAYVGESVADPLAYYDNNTAGAISLLKAMKAAGVKRLVFSSTCATYGEPEATPIVETMRQQPISPYGWSKWCVERVLRDYAAAEPTVRLRGPALLQRGGLGRRRLAGRRPRSGDALDSRAAADRLGPPEEGHASSAPIIPRPTAPASAITSTWKTCAGAHRGHGGPAAGRRPLLQPGDRQAATRSRR